MCTTSPQTVKSLTATIDKHQGDKFFVVLHDGTTMECGADSPTVLNAKSLPLAPEICKKVVAIRIPPSVAHIEKGCFTVKFPHLRIVSVAKKSKLKTIGESAFEDCKMLECVFLANAQELENIDPKAFGGCEILCSYVGWLNTLGFSRAL
jgi:hypothetical protein